MTTSTLQVPRRGRARLPEAGGGAAGPASQQSGGRPARSPGPAAPAPPACRRLHPFLFPRVRSHGPPPVQNAHTPLRAGSGRAPRPLWAPGGAQVPPRGSASLGAHPRRPESSALQSGYLPSLPASLRTSPRSFPGAPISSRRSATLHSFPRSCPVVLGWRHLDARLTPPGPPRCCQSCRAGRQKHAQAPTWASVLALPLSGV